MAEVLTNIVSDLLFYSSVRLGFDVRINIPSIYLLKLFRFSRGLSKIFLEDVL